MLQSLPAELSSFSHPESSGARSHLRGKRVGMITFSSYPNDPRPRRALDALLNEGMSADMICLADEEEARREVLDGVSIFRVPIKHHRGGKLSYAYQYFSFILASAAILAVRCMRHRYQLIYVHNMPDILIMGALIPKAFGAKVILDQHDPMPELMMTIFGLDQHSLSVRIIKALEKWSLARANLVLTVNIACKRIFGSRSCPADKVGVVMNSPDEAIFPLRAPRPRNRALNKPFVIMYHGSLLERNGVDLAVDALASLRDTVPPLELRIYGRKTTFLEQVMAQARRKGVGNSVHYLGPKSLEQLVEEIEQCDVGIIPNHRNAFTDINTPTRIFEYLAIGKPVIAPSTPGILDYFTNDSLLFVEPGNSADIARQIEHVVRNYEAAIEIAKRGQQIYLQHTWKREKATLLELVSRLLAKGKG